MHKTFYFITINKIYKKLSASYCTIYHQNQVNCKMLQWVVKYEIVYIICEVFYFFAINSQFENNTEIWWKILHTLCIHLTPYQCILSGKYWKRCLNVTWKPCQRITTSILAGLLIYAFSACSPWAVLLNCYVF